MALDLRKTWLFPSRRLSELDCLDEVMQSAARFPERLATLVSVYHDPTRGQSARSDRAELLRCCLTSLLDAADRVQAGPQAFRDLAIVVIDDYSPVDPRTLIDPDMLQRVQWLQNRGAKGQAGALNFALASVDADAFAFTDSDCVVASDWFEKMASHYRVYPNHGGVGGPNWLFSDVSRWWPRVLTAQESALMRFLTESEIDLPQATLTRIDCRNLSIRADFAARLTAAGPLFSDGHLSVSGQASYYLKSRLHAVGIPVGYCSAMRTFHQPVTSLLVQLTLYYARGRRSNFHEIYSSLYGNLLTAFVKRYGARHFITPLFSKSVSFLYLWPVHVAFWAGIVRRRWASHTHA
jgi:glycosyltransferase involved in cell wall biosynthesis